jgi:hypothetical protein
VSSKGVTPYDAAEGYAIEVHERLAGIFDEEKAARILVRSLGRNWQVQAKPRPRTKPPIFDIIAERIGDQP